MGGSRRQVAFPAHRVGAIQCVGGGILRASPPARMLSTIATDFRHPEMVWWHPRLERWQAGKWRRLVYAAPVFYAFTSSYGFYQSRQEQAWHKVGDPASRILFHPFTNLRRATTGS